MAPRVVRDAVHPVENIRGSASRSLEGRRIVLAVAGSIAAVKTIELGRELIRHGAQVYPVMSEAATRIIHPDALEFGCGRRPVTRLGGQVEHVALLGDVPEKADLLLIAPATANTVSKIALGIDDSVVTTCATVALGTRVPIVVAPAMHDAMLRHPVVQEHIDKLLSRGIGWVEPRVEEHKAKLADPETIVEAVIHRLASRDGPLAGKRCLVIGGATAERVDPVRILTNRSSGRTAVALARALSRLGADVSLWYGHAQMPPPDGIGTTRFGSHADLQSLVSSLAPGVFDQVWMPAAISDYVPEPSPQKIPSTGEARTLPLRPAPKVAPLVRAKLPDAKIVLWKAEDTWASVEEKARARMEQHKADFVIGNTTQAFGAPQNEILIVPRNGEATRLSGTKEHLMEDLARRVGT